MEGDIGNKCVGFNKIDYLCVQIINITSTSDATAIGLNATVSSTNGNNGVYGLRGYSRGGSKHAGVIGSAIGTGPGAGITHGELPPGNKVFK